jgi:membrane-bound lytic murein transglycosylase A
MTGYCTPIMAGRLEPDQEFRFPVYALPENLVKNPDSQGVSFQRQADGSLIAYPARQDLEKAGTLRGLVWLRDAFDAYIVNVQGSAKIDLPDGKRLDLGYAGTNGHPYVSIGKILVQEGKLRPEEISLPRLKQYFAAHPGEAERLISSNPRLVFFQKSGGDALGCLGYPVTAGVSIATDKRIFPASALAFVRTTIPTMEGKAVSYTGFRLDQDRGGAIDAPGRCDLYFGVGPQAEALAGQQLFEGKLYYLVLKDGSKSGGRLGKENGKVPTSRVP